MDDQSLVPGSWLWDDIIFCRRALRRDESIKYVVSDPVIEYIGKHGLFKVISWYILQYSTIQYKKRFKYGGS